MEVRLENLGKRYRHEWIFRGISQTLSQPHSVAITGPNGSGKSTLMRILAGHLSPSNGKITFSRQGQALDPDKVYQHVSFASPYMELIEEFRLEEAIRFHQQFKPFLNEMDLDKFLEILGLPVARGREIRYFSSGMKQRLKLLLAILSDTPLLLLDEPTTNLDRQGMQWYHKLIQQYGNNRLIIVASNIPEDFRFCTQEINIQDYKKKR
jgi:ABC-type multidrug transport system ATPase subunit